MRRLFSFKQEMDLEQGLSPGKKVDLGPYSRAQPTDLPAVPERRRAEETANGDVMDRSNTEEMMLGSVEDNQAGHCVWPAHVLIASVSESSGRLAWH